MNENRKKPNYFDTKQPMKRKDKHKKQEKRKKDTSTKKKWIGIVVPLILLAVIVVIIYIAVSHKTASGQVHEFKEAVDKHQYSKISEITKTNNEHITPEEAKRFVTYINKNGNKERFNKEIKAIKQTLKEDNNSPEIGKITDENGQLIFKITENGRHMLFLKELSFEPNFKNVYVKPDGQRYSYSFKNGGKERTYVAKTKGDTNIGKFFVGDYNIDAVKKFEDTVISGTTNGHLHINTDNKGKDGHVYAEEQFPQSSFKVNLENNKKLKKNIKLYINDEETDYKKNKVYGKYPNEGHITIQAEGKIYDTVVKTQLENVSPNQDDKPQVLTLKFDEEAIKKAEDKEKNAKTSAKGFIERYTNSLNHAYKMSDFKKVDHYFEDKDSSVAQHIKSQVESDRKSKYSEPEVVSYDREGNQVTIVITKKDEHGNEIKSEYTLTKKSMGGGYKIKEYTDV